jgi:hypothetical protein
MAVEEENDSNEDDEDEVSAFQKRRSKRTKDLEQQLFIRTKQNRKSYQIRKQH